MRAHLQERRALPRLRQSRTQPRRRPQRYYIHVLEFVSTSVNLLGRLACKSVKKVELENA